MFPLADKSVCFPLPFSGYRGRSLRKPCGYGPEPGSEFTNCCDSRFPQTLLHQFASLESFQLWIVRTACMAASLQRSLKGNWQEDLLFVLKQEQDGYEFCQK